MVPFYSALENIIDERNYLFYDILKDYTTIS